MWFNSSAQTKIDTTWYLKKDKFRLELISKENTISNKKNTFLKLSKNGNQFETDSLISEIQEIYFRDIDQDSIKDILVYKNSGARSNEKYYLFLYNKRNKNYKKVEGYDNWPNLNTTDEKNILSSLILAGSTSYKFFELTDSGKLNDLDIVVRDSLLTGKPYKNGLEQAKKAIEE